MRTVLLCLLAVFIPLAGCGDDSAIGVGSTLTVDNLRLVREGSSAAVQGVVVNSGTEERSVQVIIGLYDSANRSVGEVQVPVERIAAGEQQGFRQTLDEEAAAVSVRRIIAF